MQFERYLLGRTLVPLARLLIAPALVSPVLLVSGCIRFSYRTADDAGAPPPSTASSAATNGSSADFDAAAAEAAPPPPICERLGPAIADAVAGDLVSELLRDCRISSYFTGLPPVQLAHFQQCFRIQLGSVLGCVADNGQRVKYPAFDSQGQFCRDMKTAHAGASLSDGDFDAFTQDLGVVLARHAFSTDEVTRVQKTFGSTRVDIVHLPEGGATRPCDAGSRSCDGSVCIPQP